MSCSVLIVQIVLIPKRWWVRKDFSYSVNRLVSSHLMLGAYNLIKDNKYLSIILFWPILFLWCKVFLSPMWGRSTHDPPAFHYTALSFLCFNHWTFTGSTLGEQKIIIERFINFAIFCLLWVVIGTLVKLWFNVDLRFKYFDFCLNKNLIYLTNKLIN